MRWAMWRVPNPAAVVDLAMSTVYLEIALGPQAAGFSANNADVQNALMASAERTANGYGRCRCTMNIWTRSKEKWPR